MTADAFRVSLLLLLAALGLLSSFQLPSDLFFDFGPNDGRYVRGFREDFEVDEPTIIHWSGDRSSVSLPFYLRGAYDVTLRYKRHVASPAEVRFFLHDEIVETTIVPQQDFDLLELTTTANDWERFELTILSRSNDPRPLGIALDWMQVRPSSRFGAVLPSVGAMLAMLSWVLALYVVPRVLGLGLRVATISGALGAVALAVLAGAHKFWPVHASTTLGLRAHVVGLVLVAFFLVRRRVTGSAFRTTAARWAVYAIYLGLVVRLFALFHPDFYYPDVRTHSKFVSLIWTEGLQGFFADYIENQHTHLLGLQLVGDRWLAFPYPPLLYLTIYPLSLLQLPVEDWMKLVPTALLAVEALVLFTLARCLGVSPRAAALAAVLHASARVLAFRLAVASYAAMFGHLWDLVAVVYLVFFFDRIERPFYAAGFAALVAISILSYAGSALVLGMFVPAFCLAFGFVDRGRRPEMRRRIAIAGWALLGALAAITSFYWQYVPEILLRSDTAPSSSGLVDVAITPIAALSMTAYRLNLFYGVFGFLAIASLYFLRGKLRCSLAAPLAAATIVTFVGLNFLRAGLGATHIFQFSKDDLVILPLVAIALGVTLDEGFQRRWTRPVAALLLAGWIAWGAIRLGTDIQSRFLRPDYPPPPVTSASNEEQINAETRSRQGAASSPSARPIP